MICVHRPCAEMKKAPQSDGEPDVYPRRAPHRSASAARSEPFEDRRDPLPAADAHRHQRVTPANPLQLIERLGRDHRAGRADGMSKRDGAAIRVGLLHVEVEAARHGDGLRRERLVGLDDVHLAE